MNYTISGTPVSNVTFSLDLPDDVAVAQVVKPTTFVGGCTPTSLGSGSPSFDPWRYQCTFTVPSINPGQGSVTGYISLKVVLRRLTFVRDQPIEFKA